MEEQFAHIATLIGDPLRARILWALMDNRAYTATELAMVTGTTAQNMSMHLSKLINAGLLSVESQGRHKYYCFARPEVADAVEALANLVPKTSGQKVKPVKEEPIRFCRSCYDHLAGKTGVALAERLVELGYIIEEKESYSVSVAGGQWFKELGIDTGQLKNQKRHFAKPCLDWSERRHHLAGALGAALLSSLLANGWLRRVAGSRVITVTGKGRQAFFEQLKMDTA
jgi:DNA-binding transcriptional ArsR family regulator